MEKILEKSGKSQGILSVRKSGNPVIIEEIMETIEYIFNIKFICTFFTVTLIKKCHVLLLSPSSLESLAKISCLPIAFYGLFQWLKVHVSSFSVRLFRTDHSTSVVQLLIGFVYYYRSSHSLMCSD